MDTHQGSTHGGGGGAVDLQPPFKKSKLKNTQIV